MKTLFFAILIIVVAMLLFALIEKSDTKEINEFVASQHETLVNIDSQIINMGPFWYIKGTRVYKVTTTKNTYWFQLGVLWGPYLYREIENNKYEVVK